MASRNRNRVEKNSRRQRTEGISTTGFGRERNFKKASGAMRKISLGKTKSYGEIASAIGKPKAVRAVGGACGANPVPVLVPCHRVLAANKKLGGFSGGLDWKRKLLKLEGVFYAS
jgi:O-6-methylguanine DNA methyltransferase